MFWVRIRLGGREYLGVLDTGATISIVAKKILPCGSLKNTMTTAAIRMGDGHVVHSCGDCEVEVPMGSRTIAHRFYPMDTEAFDFVLGTDFFVQHFQIQSLTLQAPYLLYVDHGSGRESVPLEQSEHTSSYLRLSKEEPSNMMAASKTEDYQLLGEVLDQGLKELGYSREDLSVELFASDKQHVLDLYCSKGKNCSYKFYWPSFGMAYGNPRFSELGKVLTKVALERSRMVLCSPDWGAHGGNEYWRTLLDKLTISSVRLPDEAIYVPLGRKTPIGKPGLGSMLSVVDGSLTTIPLEDLDPTLVQAIQRESDGLALGDLKNRIRPQDAVETTPGGDENVVTDTNAPNSPCHVPVPDGVSECGLSELPSSFHSDDETEHDAFFVQTAVEEVENAEYAAPLKPLLSMRVPIAELQDVRVTETEKRGLSALAPLAGVSPSGLTPGGGKTGRPIAQANIQLELPEFDPKNLPEWAEEFAEFLLLTGQSHVDVATKCSLLKRSCKNVFLQKQVKQIVKTCSTWAEVLQRLEKTFPVYETDLSVRTQIEELPMLPECGRPCG